jgi:hypothetical protein
MRDGIGENEGYEGRESKDEDGVHDAKILRVIGRKSLGSLWGHLVWRRIVIFEVVLVQKS